MVECFFYPAQERLLRSANRADRCEALDCPVGSPCLSVGKRDKISGSDAELS